MTDFFDPQEVLNLLIGFNPWWADKVFTVPEFKRLAHEICINYIQKSSLRRAILLSGPRRVGKTTLLLQIANTLIKAGYLPKSILYLSLDHPLLKLFSLSKILTLYQQSIQAEGKPIILLLDEIQYARDWETEIKLLVDHQPNFRILATGSASCIYHHKLAESGVGRWLTVPIPTLSFYEFIHIRGEPEPAISPQLKLNDLFSMLQGDFMTLAAKLRKLLPLFQRYLLVGGFPETAREENINFCQRLLREDVVERVLKRDMTALFGVRNINELEKLFIYLCLHTGGILNHKTCADALGTSTRTVSNHLILLEKANLIYRLSPCDMEGKQILKARYKYYLTDAALRNAVLLRGEEILTNPKEMGLIVETTVLRHLYAYYYRDTPEILYWHDKTHKEKEVDIIVRSPSYVFPFEVKYSEQPKLGKESGLSLFCEKKAVKTGFLVTKNDTDFNLYQLKGMKTRILKIPAHILCYLLGQAERLLWVGC
jgi:uncharacterized protein